MRGWMRWLIRASLPPPDPLLSCQLLRVLFEQLVSMGRTRRNRPSRRRPEQSLGHHLARDDDQAYARGVRG